MNGVTRQEEQDRTNVTKGFTDQEQHPEDNKEFHHQPRPATQNWSYVFAPVSTDKNSNYSVW